MLSCSCFIEDGSQLTAIAAWLRGSGKVTFANRQGGFYYARIVNQIPFEQIMRGRTQKTFTVCFRCKPFFYLTPGADIELTESGTFITNPGAVASEPVITVEGSGEIELLVGTTAVALDIESEISMPIGARIHFLLGPGIHRGRVYRDQHEPDRRPARR